MNRTNLKYCIRRFYLEKLCDLLIKMKNNQYNKSLLLLLLNITITTNYTIAILILFKITKRKQNLSNIGTASPSLTISVTCHCQYSVSRFIFTIKNLLTFHFCSLVSTIFVWLLFIGIEMFSILYLEIEMQK